MSSLVQKARFLLLFIFRLIKIRSNDLRVSAHREYRKSLSIVLIINLLFFLIFNLGRPTKYWAFSSFNKITEFVIPSLHVKLTYGNTTTHIWNMEPS